jgi:hypothetical protein
LPPSTPTFNQELRYGDLTARGIAGGRAGENVEAADDNVENVAEKAAKSESTCIVNDADLERISQ